MFPNREIAGKLLAQKLERFFASPEDRTNIVVVGLPRGGVPVALEVARQFRCPLELIVSKKLPYPGQPEYGIGAVSSDGIVVLNPDIPDSDEWKEYVEEERQRLLQGTANLERQFYNYAGMTPSPLKNKTVIVVDDGVATGMTAMAALATARHRGATRVIMAAPVVCPDTVTELMRYCDDVVAVSVPPVFLSVGGHYKNFTQTTSEEVVSALNESKNFRNAGPVRNQHGLNSIGIT